MKLLACLLFVALTLVMGLCGYFAHGAWEAAFAVAFFVGLVVIGVFCIAAAVGEFD